MLSPAKTMDLRPLSNREFTHDDNVNEATLSQISSECEAPGQCDAHITLLICQKMKSKSEGQLKDLLSLSDNLSKVAVKFWSDFTLDSTELSDMEYRPAIYTFSGPAFKGLDPSTCDTKTLTYLASHLFILDPVYGVLPSLQGMQPYRLEMGVRLLAKNPEKNKESLSSYWKQSVTNYLGSELRKNSEGEGGGPILVNLASEEYSSSINPALLPCNTIFLNVVFRHKGRVLAVHAKRGRGSMARYLAEREASTLQDISEYDWEGYECVKLDGESWQQLDTVGDNVKNVRMIFDRDDAPPKAAADTKRSAAAGSKKKGNAGSKKAKKS